ncbi:allantoate amidohydrolase [Methylobacterium trifolii]|uniref:N-carbamoyl-L-amino acid hydrolase n=1 Tax=Methylobacterium trifolii TaxID=1003092 RepID=A0ABQ4TS58_9HYPH|nr:allantoate amidohydrolase [Methylobacterium trifolii]GJE58015.1 N-carbamoyl-L-amino acid hydrolase [Methylobacterium trifolii]
MIFAPLIQERLDTLAAISAEPGAITRLYLTPEQARAEILVSGWMREAGMSVRRDAVGNLIGRVEGPEPDAPALVIGSHLDTVRNAGRFDGPLGVLTGIGCVAALVREGVRLPVALEVVGFADEEGVRFAATLTGSRAFAGHLDPAALRTTDAAGTTLAAAMRAYGLDPGAVKSAARDPEKILGYLELHIEQGPMLEREGLAVGLVTAISGASRLELTLTGEAGHAGTVAMTERRDALAGAAECVLAIEARCRGEEHLVGTVGRIQALPGAVNTIPGQARFSLDLRAPDDGQRLAALADIEAACRKIAVRRRLGLGVALLHEADAVPCDPALTALVGAAIAEEGHPVLALPSGAGHDGMSVAAIAPIAMLFVRCRGGISHNPAEYASLSDIEAGAAVMLRAIRGFCAERTRSSA